LEVFAREDFAMSRLLYSVSVSLDGFVAGANQSEANPLGVGGELLHAWMRELSAWRRDALGTDEGFTNASTDVYEDGEDNVGAIIMGRNMFGGGPGPWGSEPWRGWWGDDPPFHLPVFVLTHYSRQTQVCEGETTFAFITEGPDRALELARCAASGRDVAISGGASVAKQFMERGLIDEMTLHLVPVLLGEGVSLFERRIVPEQRWIQSRVVEAPGVTHLTYRFSG
jgi:dihydrofolate reductase